YAHKVDDAKEFVPSQVPPWKETLSRGQILESSDRTVEPVIEVEPTSGVNEHKMHLAVFLVDASCARRGGEVERLRKLRCEGPKTLRREKRLRGLHAACESQDRQSFPGCLR